MENSEGGYSTREKNAIRLQTHPSKSRWQSFSTSHLTDLMESMDEIRQGTKTP